MLCRAELERQRLQEIYRTGRDPAEGIPGYAGRSMPPSDFPGIPGFPPSAAPGPSSTSTRSKSPTSAPPASTPPSPPSGGSEGGKGDFGDGTWSTSGPMPPGYEDFMKEMMKQQEEFMKNFTQPFPGFPPMPPMLGMDSMNPFHDCEECRKMDMGGFSGFPGMSGMPGPSSETSVGGGPGVGAFSDGANGPYSSTQTSYGELNWNSERDEPGKTSWTSPDGNSFINISVGRSI